MFETMPDLLCKGLRYFFTPFAHPRRIVPLLWLTLFNRPLVRELVRLTIHRKWFAANGFRTVIDVGGYIGSFAYAIRHLLPEAQIYSFEPLPENFPLLVGNLKGCDSFRAIQTALGEKREVVEFHRSSFSASSSVLPMSEAHKTAFPHTAGHEVVRVPMARLDDFLDELVLEPPVLLKLDVQGYEGKVLQGGVRLLEKVSCVLTEVSHQTLYEGQVSFEEMQTLMKDAGFRYAGCFDSLLSPLDGSVLQSDALFTRFEEQGHTS